MISVYLADDHTIVRQGLVSLLNSYEDCQIVGEAADGIKALKDIIELKPDVAIVDITMPKMNGMELVKQVHAKCPETKLLVLTMHEEEEYVIHMVKAGASGFLLKDSAGEELIDAVKELAQGKSYFSQYAAQVLATQYSKPEQDWNDPYKGLTTRERQVFHMVIDGKTTKQISEILYISVKTVENHRGKILEKLKVANTAELVKYAAKKNLLI
ncbi:MAG: response regulator transcription factor [Proteobacteria bacterium]|nr:response regulator transcription factor [Pseudomonadota bacterium]